MCRPGADSVNRDAATEDRLDEAGYIIGRLQRVIFYAEGIKETNWSVTAPDRRRRRRRAALGRTCTTSRTASPRSTGWIPTLRRACGW